MFDIECLCKGCMRQMDRSQRFCPRCGYDNEKTEKRSSKCLPENTILNGRYLIGRVLGEGGFGITYLALDLAEETPAAVKEYFPVGLAARDMAVSSGEDLTVMDGEQGVYYRNGLKSFAKEGQNLAHFEKLPGIVTARDFFFANETAYLVMDYIEGQSLKQYLQWYQKSNKNGAPMDYQVALAFLKPVISSLAEIHKTGLIHRDISPDNILVDKDGNVTLIDFGAARAGVMGEEMKSMTIMVKHGYAPEEQYRTHGKQGPWTDVYALCATLYHMISGRLPEDGVERLYQDNMVPLKQLTLSETVPAEISDVIEKGMAVRAKDRYRTMEELSAALENAEKIRDEREARLEEEKKAEEARLKEEKKAEEARLKAERKKEEQRRAEEKRLEEQRRKKIQEKRTEEQRQKATQEKARKEREEKSRAEDQERKKKIKIFIFVCLSLVLVMVFMGRMFGPQSRKTPSETETVSGQTEEISETEETRTEYASVGESIPFSKNFPLSFNDIMKIWPGAGFDYSVCMEILKHTIAETYGLDYDETTTTDDFEKRGIPLTIYDREDEWVYISDDQTEEELYIQWNEADEAIDYIHLSFDPKLPLEQGRDLMGFIDQSIRNTYTSEEYIIAEEISVDASSCQWHVERVDGIAASYYFLERDQNLEGKESWVLMIVGDMQTESDQPESEDITIPFSGNFPVELTEILSIYPGMDYETAQNEFDMAFQNYDGELLVSAKAGDKLIRAETPQNGLKMMIYKFSVGVWVSEIYLYFGPQFTEEDGEMLCGLIQETLYGCGWDVSLSYGPLKRLEDLGAVDDSGEGLMGYEGYDGYQTVYDLTYVEGEGQSEWVLAVYQFSITDRELLWARMKRNGEY